MELGTRYELTSVLLYPLIYWAVHGTHIVPWTSAEHSSPYSTVRGLVLAGILFAVSRHYAGLARYESRRRELKCGPVYTARLWDPILGLDFLSASLAAMKEGQMLHFYRDSFKRFGNTYYINLLGRNILMTNEPENLKAILSKKFDDWPIGGPRLDAVVPILGKKSIFSSNGEDWHEARALIRPSFVRDQVADLRCFDRHIGNLIDRIPEDGQTFNMKELLQAMSMDVSTDFMLGYSTNLLKQVSKEARQFLSDFDTSSKASSNLARLGPLLQKLPHPSIDAAARRMREYLAFYLRQAAAEKKSGSEERAYVFLDVMLQSGASEGYIIDQILSVIVAGRDTTSSAFTTCFWFLAHNPDVFAKMRAEITGTGVEEPTWEQLKNLKYLNNVIKESECTSA